MFDKIIKDIKSKFCFEEKNINGYRICNANIYKRFAAFLVDLFIISVLVVVTLSFLLRKNNINISELKSSVQTNQETVSKEESSRILIKKVSNTMFLIMSLYFFILNFYLKSSLGQKLFKLKIISVKNENITNYEMFNKALFTTFVVMIVNVPVLIIFFILPLMLTNYKVTLLDMITNTNIIELKKIN